jgi:hypothetical protein
MSNEKKEIPHKPSCPEKPSPFQVPNPLQHDGMASTPEPEDGRELYALLHLSPDTSDEEIRRTYHSITQIYHPDKYQDL